MFDEAEDQAMRSVKYILLTTTMTWFRADSVQVCHFISRLPDLRGIESFLVLMSVVLFLPLIIANMYT